MPCWSSPWPVAPTLNAHLKAAGLNRCAEPLEDLPSDALVLYSPPDVLMASGMTSSTDPPTPQQLLDFYKFLQGLCGRHRVMATWRLEGLPAEAISPWLADASPLKAPSPVPTPDPLSALVTKALLEAQPDLLEAYLDLELSAELAGGTPDTGYRQRISQAAADPYQLLRSWWLPHQRWQASQRDTTAQMARAEALQSELGQVQAELGRAQANLDRVVGVDQEKSLQIGHLQTALGEANTKVITLEADVAQVREERAGVARDRDAMAQARDALARARNAVARERDAVARERDALVAEKAETMNTVTDLQHQLTAQTEALRLARDTESQLRSTVEALEGEKRQTAEEVERLGLELGQMRMELERLVGVDQEKSLQIGHLQTALGEANAKVITLEADVAQVREERDGVARDRDAMAQARDALARARNAVARERDALVAEKAETMNTVTDLQHQLTAQTEALRLARDTESQLRSTVEALEGEKRQTVEEVKNLLTQLHELQEELERRFLADQSKTAQIDDLRHTLDTQTAQISALEAERQQLRQAHEDALREKHSLALEREALEQEMQAATATVTDLQHQLTAQTEALRLARDTESQLRSTTERLAVEQQQTAKEAGRLLSQLHDLQEDLERRFLADQSKTAQIDHLRHSLDTQTAQISTLEAERQKLRQAHEGALIETQILARERDAVAAEKSAALTSVNDLQHQLAAQSEALRLARDTESQLRRTAEALAGENGQLKEESRVLLVQMHHLQEELEKTFLEGQAGHQLIAAQHQQLLRAQSLLSRLLVQATRSAMAPQSIAVEVLPSRPTHDLSPTLAGDASRQGWGSGLMRKILTR
jgi:chromosome segregation ATPase